MLLSEIDLGVKMSITGIEPCAFKEKLMEMGCIPGASITLTMIAPMGDPLAFNLEGYCLSMRRSEAKYIIVEPKLDEGK